MGAIAPLRCFYKTDFPPVGRSLCDRYSPPKVSDNTGTLNLKTLPLSREKRAFEKRLGWAVAYLSTENRAVKSKYQAIVTWVQESLAKKATASRYLLRFGRG